MDGGLLLLDFAENLFQDVKLEDTLVIACQHILETNYIMFNYLFGKGLSPKNTFLIGKCYSTNKETLEKFKKKGVYIHKGSTAYNSHLSFDEQFGEEIIDFINHINNKVNLTKYAKVILVDDGGYLIYWANNLLKNHRNLVAIEQTSSGYVKLKEIKLSFPVINIARSNAKLNFESPFIADTAVIKLKNQLKNLNATPEKVLIIGAGSIGSQIFKILKDDFDVKRYDLIKKDSDIKIEKFKSLLGQFDLIIGCTGESVISKEDYGLLKKGAILVSVSSSDREFSSSNLRKILPKNNDCHKNLIINGITLVNSGFPVNFDGLKHSAKPELIQLTRALIFSGVCLANKESYSNSLIDLDKDIQEKLVKEFKSMKTNKK